MTSGEDERLRVGVSRRGKEQDATRGSLNDETDDPVVTLCPAERKRDDLDAAAKQPLEAIHDRARTGDAARAENVRHEESGARNQPAERLMPLSDQQSSGVCSMLEILGVGR